LSTLANANTDIDETQLQGHAEERGQQYLLQSEPFHSDPVSVWPQVAVDDSDDTSRHWCDGSQLLLQSVHFVYSSDLHTVDDSDDTSRPWCDGSQLLLQSVHVVYSSDLHIQCDALKGHLLKC